VVVQQNDGINLFLQPYLQMPPAELLSLSRDFSQYISKLRSDDFGPLGPKSTQNFKTGSVVLQHYHTVLYSLLNEVYILIVASENEYYEALHVLNRVKRLLIAACKGVEATQIQLSKKYGEIYLGLERILFGEDGVDVLSQKILEATPYSMSVPANLSGLTSNGKVYENSIQYTTVPTSLSYNEDTDVKQYRSMRSTSFILFDSSQSETRVFQRSGSKFDGARKASVMGLRNYDSLRKSSNNTADIVIGSPKLLHADREIAEEKADSANITPPGTQNE